MFIHIDKFMGERGGTRTRSNPLHGSLLHAVQGLKRAPATNRIWTRAPASANFSSPLIGLGFTLHRLVSSFTGGSPFRLRAPHELAACCYLSLQKDRATRSGETFSMLYQTELHLRH